MIDREQLQEKIFQALCNGASRDDIAALLLKELPAPKVEIKYVKTDPEKRESIFEVTVHGVACARIV